MGLTWKRDPLAKFLEGDSPHPYMDLREEFALHRFLTRLEGLRSSASSEINLRGPFPNAAYGRILKSTGSMLDAFHAMNVVIMKDPAASKGEAELLKFTANERSQLCSRISHLFQGKYTLMLFSNVIFVWKSSYTDDLSSRPSVLTLTPSHGIIDETRVSPERCPTQHRPRTGPAPS